MGWRPAAPRGAPHLAPQATTISREGSASPGGEAPHVAHPGWRSATRRIPTNAGGTVVIEAAHDRPTRPGARDDRQLRASDGAPDPVRTVHTETGTHTGASPPRGRSTAPGALTDRERREPWPVD